MAATPKVAPVTGSFAPTANTRLGDGLRATSSSQPFAPITEVPDTAEVGLENQGLRNDDWGFEANQRRRRKDSSGTPASDIPVRFGTVVTNNAVPRTLFEVKMRDPGPPTHWVNRPQASREAASIYQGNAQVLMASATNTPLVGREVSRYT